MKTLEMIKEVEKKKNIVHRKHAFKFEEWSEYDDFDRLKHYRNSKGFEAWYEYDAEGNCTHYKNSKGVEEWYQPKNTRRINPDRIIELTLEEIARKFRVSVRNLKIHMGQNHMLR